MNGYSFKVRRARTQIHSKLNQQKAVRNMTYLFLLPQSMLDKLESCGKLSLPHCTLAKIKEEKILILQQ